MSEEPAAPVDALFLERLETLYEKSLADLRAFAQREGCPFEEVRRRIAEWHCKHLFQFDSTPLPYRERVEGALRHISGTLESLQNIAGLQAFFLVVNPRDPDHKGFLGGTVVGREFWRGHRGCGDPGAQAFKHYCETSGARHVAGNDLPSSLPAGGSSGRTSTPVTKKGPAGSLKAEVYSSVRNALREASGIRTAEMKWTNHAKLDTFGVRLVGWPASVPTQNPSQLSVSQNQTILDAIRSGSMSFVPTNRRHAQEQEASSSSSARYHEPTPQVEVDVFRDTLDFSWVGEERRIDTPHEQPSHSAPQGPIPPPNEDQPQESIFGRLSGPPPTDRLTPVEPVQFVDPALLHAAPYGPHPRKRRRDNSDASQDSVK